MKSLVLSSLTILASLALANSVMAQTNDVQGQLSSRDYKFAREATAAGQSEVTLGNLAAQNAQDPAVKDFASKMVTDHQKANEDLQQIIGQKGASVSTDPGLMAKATNHHLEGLKGPDFDQAYMKDMVRDHKEAVKLFQKEATNGDDAELKSFASRTLPTLQDHLSMAEQVEAKLSASASR